MSDLVKRLRLPVDPDDPNLWVVDKNRLEAADRIEALEAALRQIRDNDYPNYEAGYNTMIRIARAALDKDAGIGCGKSVIEPWAEEQDK